MGIEAHKRSYRRLRTTRELSPFQLARSPSMGLELDHINTTAGGICISVYVYANVCVSDLCIYTCVSPVLSLSLYIYICIHICIYIFLIELLFRAKPFDSNPDEGLWTIYYHPEEGPKSPLTEWRLAEEGPNGSMQPHSRTGARRSYKAEDEGIPDTSLHWDPDVLWSLGP